MVVMLSLDRIEGCTYSRSFLWLLITTLLDTMTVLKSVSETTGGTYHIHRQYESTTPDDSNDTCSETVVVVLFSAGGRARFFRAVAHVGLKVASQIATSTALETSLTSLHPSKPAPTTSFHCTTSQQWCYLLRILSRTHGQRNFDNLNQLNIKIWTELWNH